MIQRNKGKYFGSRVKIDFSKTFVIFTIGSVLEARASRWMRQCVVMTSGFFLTRVANPDLEPSMLEALSLQTTICIIYFQIFRSILTFQVLKFQHY